jgi:hypothetical protein
VTIISENYRARRVQGHRQYRVQAVECLNGRFLIHAEQCCVLRRIQTQPDDVSG